MEKKKKDKDMPVDELLEQLKLVFNIEDETAEKAKSDAEEAKLKAEPDIKPVPDNGINETSDTEKKKKDKKKFSLFARKKDNGDDTDDIEPFIGAVPPADSVSDDDIIEDFSFLNDGLDIAPLKEKKTPEPAVEADTATADEADAATADEADAVTADEADAATADEADAATADEADAVTADDETVIPADVSDRAEAVVDDRAESAFSFLFEGENGMDADKTEAAAPADDAEDGNSDTTAGNGGDSDSTIKDDEPDDIFVFTPFEDGDVKTAPSKNAEAPDEADDAGTLVMDKLPLSDDDDIFLSDDEYKLSEEAKELAKKDREATILHDVSEFDSLFDDENSEDDGYSSSEKAIMNALDEAPKPEKKKKLSAKKQAENDDEEFMSRVSTLSGNTQSDKKHSIRHGAVIEYTSVSQRSDFISGYKKRYGKAEAALIGSSFFALLMLIYECLALFGAKLPQFCSPAENPAVFILIDLQLFVFCAAFAYKELLTGVRGIFNGEASSESLGALAALLTVLYGIISAFVRTEASGLFMLPAAFAIICMLSSSLRRIKRTVLAFRITSSKSGGKYVLDLCKPDETDGARAAFGEYLPENPMMLKINRADFIEGFAERSDSPSKRLSSVNIFLPVTALVFAAVFGVLILTGKGAADSVQFAYIASMICIPVSFFTAVTFPAYSASKKAFGDDSCIISDAGADEYAGASIVAFDDSDVFPVANDKINGVKLYDENRIDHITYLVTSVFSKLGGPLKDIFDSVRADSDCCESTDITSIEYDGVSASINAEIVLIGSASYIERNGITPGDKYSHEDNLEETSGRARVMFVAANGRIVAKFRISYKADKDFISLLKQLSETSRCVAIKTLDPNIDTDLLKSDINTKKYTVEVVKCKSADELGHKFPTSSAAVISKRSPKALLRTLLLCDKMSFSTKTNVLICFLSVLIGLLVTLFMIITGTMDKLNSIYITLYHLVFIAAVTIATKLYI